MPFFTKKPVTIEAVQFTGDNTAEVRAFCPEVVDAPVAALDIPTLEGTMRAGPGDWIIKGVKGEFYPCKADVFAASYDAADAA